jgi:hypothetical protein
MPLWVTVCLAVSATVVVTGAVVYLINMMNHE